MASVNAVPLASPEPPAAAEAAGLPQDAVPASAPRPWTRLQRGLFRFGFVYLLFFNLPFPIGWLPGTDRLAEAFSQLWQTPAQLFATHVLGVRHAIDFADTGSSDRLADWSLLGLRLALAALIAAGWSFASRATDHRRLHGLLRVYLRYSLGTTLLAYGYYKVFKSQFAAAGPTELLKTYGESSPMNLLWTFMGFSTAYNFFCGLAEAVPGVLLYFRRTTTLGALLGAAVMANVVALNFSYDVPVKLYSVHLLVAALVLLLPDARRLADVFVLNRPAAPVDLGRAAPDRRWRLASIGAKVALIGGLQALILGMAWSNYKAVTAPKHTLVGVWKVQEQRREGQPVPPLASDPRRLKSVVLLGRARLGGAQLIGLDDQVRSFGLQQDEKAGTIDFREGMGAAVDTLRVERPDPSHLVLQGKLGGEETLLKLERVDTSSLLLLNRGFHWVTESAFNR